MELRKTLALFLDSASHFPLHSSGSWLTALRKMLASLTYIRCINVIRFIDNTDPAGIDHQIAQLGPELASTLVIVISKSGGTPETRNGLLEVQKAFREAGLDFSKQGVAITQENSLLDNTAKIEGWLARFPMFDWVGGRTSEMSAVGLLAAALQGIDIKEMLVGASLMDEATRSPVVKNNPAALLALCWYWASDGVGSKDMVVVPYKDSLLLFSRYLQQLVMESLGKEFDLNGNRIMVTYVEGLLGLERNEIGKFLGSTSIKQNGVLKCNVFADKLDGLMVVVCEHL
ncbi:glucose-6-phosphate isomerase 1, chloroplastic-like [Curcuma longa]|uniref:glucose-6-phosphate isomerase 1, chloroplastic-like n=1 Tax=Curcuma longa TaxID=136217 RepID=UPI003D9F686D